LTTFSGYLYYLCHCKGKVKSNNRVQTKVSHQASNNRLSNNDIGRTGNDLVTELCPKRIFPCLFPSLSTSFVMIKNVMNQLICSDLLIVALECCFAADSPTAPQAGARHDYSLLYLLAGVPGGLAYHSPVVFLGEKGG
jgi:hypothetical protein